MYGWGFGGWLECDIEDYSGGGLNNYIFEWFGGRSVHIAGPGRRELNKLINLPMNMNRFNN